MEEVIGQMTWDHSRCLSAPFFRTGLREVIDSSVYAYIGATAGDTVELPRGLDVWLDRASEREPFILLSDLHSKRYGLKQPICLQRQVYQGYSLVSDVIIYRHGLGISIEEAILDYEEDIISYFESLRQNRQNLSPALEADLEQLEQYIKER